VKDLWQKLEDAVYAGNGETYCAGLTQRMTRQITRDAKRDTCEGAVRSIVEEPLTPVQVAQVESKLVSVRVDGDKALLATRGPDGGIDHRTFVKDGPEWKLDRTRWEAVPAPDPSSGAKPR
jgi:hypothetical protein